VLPRSTKQAPRSAPSHGPRSPADMQPATASPAHIFPCSFVPMECPTKTRVSLRSRERFEGSIRGGRWVRNYLLSPRNGAKWLPPRALLLNARTQSLLHPRPLPLKHVLPPRNQRGGGRNPRRSGVGSALALIGGTSPGDTVRQAMVGSQTEALYRQRSALCVIRTTEIDDFVNSCGGSSHRQER